METTIRSLFKAVSWRITGTFATFGVSWLITGTAAVAATIAATEVVAKIVLYWLHERAWNRTTWGKNKPRLPSPQQINPAPTLDKKTTKRPTRSIYT
ncbi:hypothetical protein CCP3SC15_140010 [Gammaproteobacteria bacterium]